MQHKKGDEPQLNTNTLTNEYLYLLAQTDIDTKTFTEIDAFLKEKLDSFTKENSTSVPADRVKAILIDKLKNIHGVDKVSINDESGFQLRALDIRANGEGPVTILIIKDGK